MIVLSTYNRVHDLFPRWRLGTRDPNKKDPTPHGSSRRDRSEALRLMALLRGNAAGGIQPDQPGPNPGPAAPRRTGLRAVSHKPGATWRHESTLYTTLSYSHTLKTQKCTKSLLQKYAPAILL